MNNNSYKTSIHITACAVGAEEHNSRDQEYLNSLDRSDNKSYEIFRDRTPLNDSWRNPQYEGKTLAEIKDDCRQRYTEIIGQKPNEAIKELSRINKRTGRPVKVTIHGWSPIREGVCVIKPTTTIKDFTKVVEWLKTKGLTVISIFIHRDEGHVDPKTGERVYNYHAHIIIDWTDHASGKTIKLAKADMSELNQVILPHALGMEPGVSRAITGNNHLTPAQYREKAAGERANELEEQSRIREENIEQSKQREMEQLEREKEAKTRAERAEKRAAKEEIKQRVKEIEGSILDLFARILRVFGHGAIARAQEEAYEAIHQLEEEKTQRIKAEVQRDSAIASVLKAGTEKEEYGKEQYENGYQAGIKAGGIDLGKMRKRARMAEEEIENIGHYIPNTRNFMNNLQDMKDAGMTDEDIHDVFANGGKENVTVTVIDSRGDEYIFNAKVDLDNATNGEYRVWFNDLSLSEFKKEKVAQEKNRGIRM